MHINIYRRESRLVVVGDLGKQIPIAVGLYPPYKSSTHCYSFPSEHIQWLLLYYIVIVAAGGLFASF